MSTVCKLKSWLFQPVDRVILQVPRALVASILSALLDCLYMIFLVEICRWHPVQAAILSYLVGGFLQYILCSIWVFPAAPRSKAVGFLPFTLLSLGGLAITWGVMALGAMILMPYGISKILALGLAFVWNFASRKYLLFEKRGDADDAAGKPPAANVPKDYTAWITNMAKVTTARSISSPDLDVGGEMMLRAASAAKSR